MLNKVILIGNVGGDPDIRSLPNGGRVANFSLATTEFWKDKSGNKQSATEWHRIVIFNENLIKLVEKAVRKGSKLYIEGSIRSRKYTSSSDSVERLIVEIILQGFGDEIKLLDPRPTDGNGGNRFNKKDEHHEEDSHNESDDSGDEIPF